MSRLTKKAIEIPKGVEFKLENDEVHVKGPKGSLKLKLKRGINLKIEATQVMVEKNPTIHLERGLLGLYWAMIKNLVLGVSRGFEKNLTLIGVGFRANVKGNKIELQIGLSHNVEIPIPKDINVKIDKSIDITISGADKQLVGQFAAQVRANKPPEPYKGKGIRYKDEYVRKKAGKAAKAKAA